MKTESIIHNSLTPDLYLTERNCLHIRLVTAREDMDMCQLIYFTRTSPSRRMHSKMQCTLRDAQKDYHEAEILFPQVARYLKYYFKLKGRDGTTAWYSAWGIQEKEPEDGFFEFLYANGKDCIQIPEWSKGQVIYQIFPDRFYNGNSKINPPGCVKWGSPPDREHYMGGNLAGIRAKLPYLKSLGVECLYLNPIFKADFNHKYATEDYFEVDPVFGTKDELKELVRECHLNEIRVILDGVFNHCGTRFLPFVDLLEHQEDSAYREWFLVNQYPVTVSEHCYECVGAYRWMPKLNTANPQVRQFVLKVMRYWLEETEIDGWRLDVADEVDSSIWTQARIELKEAFPHCMLLGETWGSGAKMMTGNQMDSIMNYGIRDAIRDFIARDILDARGFDERINHLWAAYPSEMRKGLYNLLDSHDTERFLTLCGGDIKKLKIAVALQMLLPGAPAIYYGDEAGMEGENDPDCRRGFPWGECIEEKPIYLWYQELIALRKKEPVVRNGTFGSIFCKDRIYGFYRSMDETQIYIICNPGEEQQICLPVRETGAYDIIFPKTMGSEELTVDSPMFKAVQSAEDNFYNGDIIAYGGVVSLTVPQQAVLVIKKIH